MPHPFAFRMPPTHERTRFMPGQVVGIDLDAFCATCAQVGAAVSAEEARALLHQRGFRPDAQGRWSKTIRPGYAPRKTSSAAPPTSPVRAEQETGP